MSTACSFMKLWRFCGITAVRPWQFRAPLCVIWLLTPRLRWVVKVKDLLQEANGHLQQQASPSLFPLGSTQLHMDNGTPYTTAGAGGNKDFRNAWTRRRVELRWTTWRWLTCGSTSLRAAPMASPCLSASSAMSYLSAIQLYTATSLTISRYPWLRFMARHQHRRWMNPWSQPSTCLSRRSRDWW
ncbi:uncharacterized protein [Lolium perenne]|uniref:uncharacterized protein isoform X3 n=1 Tax=Lolium perenne TaxID=4522 RepID=UPI003A9A1543